LSPQDVVLKPARGYPAGVSARFWPILLVAVCVGLALAGGGASAPVSPCSGSQLTGTFAVIPGSAGAGNIVYALRVRLVSGPCCFVSGLPGLLLLDRLRRPLPTHVTPAFRQGLTAVRVVLAPGHGAKATARFSPDVPGPGEPVAGRNCERTSFSLRVTPTPGGGTFVVPVRPVTPVCEHGGMQVSAFSRT
jgi:hypothetical protein